MKMISEMSSHTLYFTIKMFLTNLELLNKRKSKRKKPREVLRLEPKKKLKFNNKWLI